MLLGISLMNYSWSFFSFYLVHGISCGLVIANPLFSVLLIFLCLCMGTPGSVGFSAWAEGINSSLASPRLVHALPLTFPGAPACLLQHARWIFSSSVRKRNVPCFTRKIPSHILLYNGTFSSAEQCSVVQRPLCIKTGQIIQGGIFCKSEIFSGILSTDFISHHCWLHIHHRIWCLALLRWSHLVFLN